MSSKPFDRMEPRELKIMLVGQRISAATILFHTAVAERLGVNATDFKCHTLLTQLGELTAGELAERTGLTTGAITGVIDRLEEANLVRRAPDPNDRRRVVIELLHNPERDDEIEKLFEPMSRAIFEAAAKYSDEELNSILEFISNVASVMESETQKLRQMD